MTTPDYKIEPGIYPDMDIEEYHFGPGLSSTELKPILETVDDFVWERENDDISTEARDAGRLLHDAILPDSLDHAYRFYSKTKTRGAKAYRKFCEKHDCIGLFESDMVMVSAIRRQIADHPRLNSVLSASGDAEVSYFAEIQGHLCKARPDYVVEDDKGLWIFDLKSTRKGKGHPRRWPREMLSRGYHISAGMYCDVVETVTGKPVHGFVHIVVEKEGPWKVAGHNLGAKTISLGREKFREALGIYDAWKRGEVDYTGYSDEFFETDVPHYAFKEE